MAFPTATVTQGSGLTVNTLPNAGQATMANSLGVAIASDQSAIPVTIGATLNVAQSAVWTVQIGNTPNTVAIKVDNSAVTQPISAAALPLPSGASTSAKQPALGTAGVASADVISVQGLASMTPLKVDGSGVTQPISAAALPLPTGAATNAGSASINTGQVPVTTGNTLIVAARAGRAAVTIRNLTGTGQISVGVTGVGVTTSFVLLAVAGDSITIPTTAAVYGTVAATTQTVCFVETFT
jgi:hypothetical protein